jgi:hypothetical protein
MPSLLTRLKPIEALLKNLEKEQHYTSLPSCNPERKAEKIYSYYYIEKCSSTYLVILLHQ